MFQKFRLLWTSEPFILVAGVVQKQDGVIHVKAQQIEPLKAGEGPGSHDFH